MRTFLRYDKLANRLVFDNIAVLRLAREVKYTKWISPICLPTADHLFKDHDYVGATFVVSGWNALVCTCLIVLFSILISKTLLLTYIYIDNVTPAIKFKEYARIVSDSDCEGIWNNREKAQLFYDRYSNFCLIRGSPKCRASAGTIMAIDNGLSTPYWYAVGFKVRSGCAGYQVCVKLIPHVYWIKYILSFEYDDYSEYEVVSSDLMDYDYTNQRGGEIKKLVN